MAADSANAIAEAMQRTLLSEANIDGGTLCVPRNDEEKADGKSRWCPRSHECNWRCNTGSCGTQQAQKT